MGHYLVVLGIKDKPGGADAFVGTSINADKLRSAIYDRTEPHLTVSIEEVHYEGSRLLQITVPEGLEVYSTSQGEYCQRWMSECRPMDPGAVARLSDERRGNDWSAESSGTPIDAVDTTAIEKVRELLRLTDDDARVHLSRSSPAEIVRRLGLAADDGCLTRAGEILLVEKSSSGPQELLVYQHRRTPSGEADFMSTASLMSPLVAR